MTQRELAILQPYVPAYRVPLFDGLATALAQDGVRLRVVAPPSSGELDSRGDATTGHPWLHLTTGIRSPRFGPARLHNFKSSAHLADVDALIMPLWGTLLDAHRVLWRPRSRRVPIGLWGHVAPFVAPENRVDLAAEKAMMRRADHIFAYTAAGARFATAAGIDSAKITNLENTIDTTSLRQKIAATAPEEVEQFRHRHGLRPGTRAFAYIGGLDESKRVDYLADVLEHLHALDPDARVLVGGQGVDASLLDPARARGQVVMLGYIGNAEKALLSTVCDAIVNPGRIGLLAVDALVMQRPVVTSEYELHAPEVAYLNARDSLFRIDGGPGAFAELLVGHRFQRPADTAPSLTHLVERFTRGIRTMIAPAASRE